MPTLFALFAIVAVPILFFMLMWVVVTACRIFFPETPQVVERETALRRRRMLREGVGIPVGAREISEDQRYLFSHSEDSTYYYAHGDSDGLPMTWYEELQQRRN